MLNFRSMAKSASRRKEVLESKISAAKTDLVAMEEELKVLETILEALPKGAASRGPGRPLGAGKKRKGGKWRPGRPGRPPKWYLDQQKGKGKGAKARKPARSAKHAKVKKPGRKRPASEKQLAAMAKARAALAAKRAALVVAPKPG
jgi:hypothetical protein